MTRIWRLAAAVAAAATTLLVAGFVWFVADTRRVAVPPPHADAIVVLTGGSDRVEAGLRLLQAGAAGRLLVSGVSHGASLADVARPFGVDVTALAGRITLGHEATSTYGNARETAQWAFSGMRSLIVVTAGYHMPRALLELRRALPGVTLYEVPVEPPAMRHPAALIPLLLREYLKLIAATVGLSETRGIPVGKSVDG